MVPSRESAVGDVLQWFYRQRVLLVTFCSGFKGKGECCWSSFTLVLRTRESAVGDVSPWYRQGRVLLVTFCSGVRARESAVSNVLPWF